VADLMSWDSLLQTEAASTTKARSSIEECLVAGMTSEDDAAERVCGRVHRPHVTRRMTGIGQSPLR